MIIRFGKNIQALAPAPPGTKLDRLVSFVDLPPSLLSLAGAAIPSHLQGKAFLGPRAAPPRSAVFGFRGRMDERDDLSYTIRDARYRYIRNFYPHRIYGQRLDYLWRMPATRSWEKAFKEGTCDEVQSAFWRPKPSEELYDEEADPYEVHNLAGRPEAAETLARLRSALREQLIQNRDAGLLPESEMLARAKGDPIYVMTQDESRYPFMKILEAAEVASLRDPAALPRLVGWMKDPDPAVRTWAAIGCSVRGEQAASAAGALRGLRGDPSANVRISAAEALVRVGEAEGLEWLVQELGAPGGDALAALDSLASLGARARPVQAAIQAKIAKGSLPESRQSRDGTTRYVDQAAGDLMKGLDGN
jgi:hypothetical protein